MNSGKICIAAAAETAAELIELLKDAQADADIVEVRFDSLLPDEIEPMMFKFASLGLDRPVIATYRPAEQGGRRRLTRDERLEFWTKHRHLFEAIDLEEDIASDVPADTFRIASHHHLSSEPDDPAAAFDRLATSRSDVIKYAAPVHTATDAIPIWKLIERASNAGRGVIPIAMGEAGKWTRILGPAFGSYLAYASPNDGQPTAAGQINAADMRDLFRVKDLSPATEIYGIIAGDTSYSMSPYIHNAAFRELSMGRVFVPFQVDEVGEFFRRMVHPKTREIELNIAGFSVTNPHKQSVITHLDEIDDAATKIGAVNTVTFENGRLIGTNTDAAGFIEPLLAKFGDVAGARVAVIGAGGAARACVYALIDAGAIVDVFARDRSKADAFANDFGCGVGNLDTPIDADLLVNATPLGTLGAHENETPVQAQQLKGFKLVYDLTYNPRQTRLLADAAQAGCETLDGLEMLIAQAARQFKLWTGVDAPTATMRDAVLARLPK